MCLIHIGDPKGMFLSTALVAVIKGCYPTSCCGNPGNITELSEVMNDLHSQQD